MSIRIALADDHRIFREALAAQLAGHPEVSVLGEAGTAAEALAMVARLQPDVLVLDIGLPDMSGIELTSKICQQQPAVRVVALTGYHEKIFVEEMLKAGARGYVVKSAGIDELLNAIRAVAAGRSFLCPQVTAILHGPAPRPGEQTPPLSVLGPREQEVLRHLASGLRATVIAEQMGIAIATVEAHRRNIKDKLHIRTTAELTRYAIRERLISA